MKGALGLGKRPLHRCNSEIKSVKLVVVNHCVQVNLQGYLCS